MLSLVNKTLYKTVSFIVLVEEKMVWGGGLKGGGAYKISCV